MNVTSHLNTMRYNVLGTDPETGEAVELIFSAETVADAARAAQRRNLHVMSVSPTDVRPAEAGPGEPTQALAVPVEHEPVQRRPTKVTLLNAVLVTSLLLGLFLPVVSLTTGIALALAVGCYCVVSPSRSFLRHLLGMRADKRLRRTGRLLFLGLYAGALFVVTSAGVEMQQAQRIADEHRAAEKAAMHKRQKEQTAQVGELLATAKAALERGDVVSAAEATRNAGRARLASNRAEAVALADKINGATQPQYALRLLSHMPQEEFDQFRVTGELVPTLDSGYTILNTSILANARDQAAAAAQERARLAAEATERLQRQRKAAEQAKRNAQIERHFSKWDGSHRGLTQVIKKSMNNPGSYDHVETKYWETGDHLVVRTTFRGTNAFGGLVTNWVRAKVDLDGNVLQVLEQGP